MEKFNLMEVNDEGDAVDLVKDLSDQELMRQVPLVLRSDRELLMCEILDEVGARGIYDAAPYVGAVIDGSSGSDMARTYAIHAAHDLKMSREVLRCAESGVRGERDDRASVTACAYGLSYDVGLEDKAAMRAYILARCSASIQEGCHYTIYAAVNAFRNIEIGADSLIAEIVVSLWRECPEEWGAKEDLRCLVDELGGEGGQTTR